MIERTKGLLLCLFVLFISIATSVSADSANKKPVDDTIEIMESFNQQALAEAELRELAEKTKHEVLFYMGAGLLLLVFTTAYLGISMVVFNKDVFVLHMISAGLTVTLAMAHAVAAMVWFFPF